MIVSKAYFFSGDQYARYDLAADKVDDGYPLPIQPHWPGMPFTHIDAAVMWNNGKAYFFSGDQYARYDVATDKVDDGYPLPTQPHWPGMPFTHIDAATMWNNGKAYFFGGDHYARYDVATDKVDDGYPLPTQPHWPGMPFTNIGASIMWTSPTGATLVFEEKVRDNQLSFVTKVRSVCTQLGVNPDWLMAMMYHESGLNPAVTNSIGAVGLIQFLPSTAQALGTTTEALRAMSNVEQLDWVHKYFSSHRGRMHSYTDLYLAAFYPIAMGRGDDFVCGSEISPERARAVRHDNMPVDLNGDGVISVGEFRQWTVNNLPAEVRQRLGI
jgi:hypothetical protein